MNIGVLLIGLFIQTGGSATIMNVQAANLGTFKTVADCQATARVLTNEQKKLPKANAIRFVCAQGALK